MTSASTSRSASCDSWRCGSSSGGGTGGQGDRRQCECDVVGDGRYPEDAQLDHPPRVGQFFEVTVLRCCVPERQLRRATVLFTAAARLSIWRRIAVRMKSVRLVGSPRRPRLAPSLHHLSTILAPSHGMATG